MEGSAEIKPDLQQEFLKYAEKGPRLVDIANNLQGRDNIIKSNIIETNTYKHTERSFTEKEGIENLLNFISRAEETAKENGDNQKEEEAKLFKDNIVYIGEAELKEATQGIARHLLSEAQRGKNVILYPPNMRSERYIALRVIEEVDYLTELTQDIRERIKISQNSLKVAKFARESLGKCIVAVPDDFIVSGTRIRGFLGRILSALTNEGITREKAVDIVEADVVAMPEKKAGRVLTTTDSNNNGSNLNINSFYEVPEYKNNEGSWVVFTGVSMTGSHSSTDYGFEDELEKLHDYMKSKGVKIDLPLLHQIKRPYEMLDNSSSRYKNEELQKRWEKVEQKYGLKTDINN